MSAFFSTTLPQALRTTIPYAAAALGGVWCERSGVVTIALEGMLLTSAFVTTAVGVATHDPWLALGAGILASALIGWFHAASVEIGKVTAIISGLAINLIALGGTRFLLRSFYGSTSNSPSFVGFDGAAASLFGRLARSPTTWLLCLALAGTLGLFRRTSFGLRVRAVGEAPTAATSLGISVTGVRLAACALGGAITGIGGAAMALDQHQFQSGMSAGRGFMALAAVILARWEPTRAILYCAIFALADAAQLGAQGSSKNLENVFAMLPFLLALGAMFVLGRKTPQRAP